jgi:hypothetical protein
MMRCTSVTYEDLKFYKEHNLVEIYLLELNLAVKNFRYNGEKIYLENITMLSQIVKNWHKIWS